MTAPQSSPFVTVAFKPDFWSELASDLTDAATVIGYTVGTQEAIHLAARLRARGEYFREIAVQDASPSGSTRPPPTNSLPEL